MGEVCQPRVPRPVDLAHSAPSEERQTFIGPQPRAGPKRHARAARFAHRLLGLDLVVRVEGGDEQLVGPDLARRIFVTPEA